MNSRTSVFALLLTCIVLLGWFHVIPAIRGHEFQSEATPAPAVVQCRDDEIPIKGLDRVLLLRELWHNQQVHGMGVFGGGTAKWNEDTIKHAHEAVKGYIDYFQGRAIKMNLSGDCIDPWLYDRDTRVKASITIIKIRTAASDRDKNL